MKIWHLILTLFLPFSLKAQGPMLLTERQAAQQLHACERSYHVRYALTGPVSSSVDLLVLDPKEIRFEVVDQPERSLATIVKEMAQRKGAIAGVNGGYFTLDFEPLGLFKSGNLTFGEVSPSSLVGGFFTLTQDKPAILWRDQFQHPESYTTILQTGPRLVNNGVSTRGLEATKKRPRTFIATTKDGLWIVGNASKLSLKELGELLSTPNLIPNLTVDRALNFDGGRSAAMYWKDSQQQEHSIEEVVIVRNLLLIHPKKS